MTEQVFRLAPAGCSVDVFVDVSYTPPDHPEVAAEHVQTFHTFVIDPYVVDQGIPRDTPEVGVMGRSLVGIGKVDYSDQPMALELVNTNSQARWLPTEETFANGRWTPFSGDASLQWVAGPQASPVLDQGYSYARRDDEVPSKALLFNGMSYLAFNTQGLSANAFTLAMVVVLQPGEGATYSVVESNQETVANAGGIDENAEDGTQSSDLALRYSHGRLGVFCGGQVVEYTATAKQQTPIVVVLSLDPEQGRLSVFDGRRSTRTFSLEGVAPFDVELLMGRSGVAFDTSTSAVMDVLEVDFFDHALDASSTEAYLNLMTSVHGIV